MEAAISEPVGRRPAPDPATVRILSSLAVHEGSRWMPIGSLLPADSPRLEGERLDHVRALADAVGEPPPILVHRHSRRVIDGMHRLRAAQLRGERMIEVR